MRCEGADNPPCKRCRHAGYEYVVPSSFFITSWLHYFSSSMSFPPLSLPYSPPHNMCNQIKHIILTETLFSPPSDHRLLLNYLTANAPHHTNVVPITFIGCLLTVVFLRNLSAMSRRLSREWSAYFSILFNVVPSHAHTLGAAQSRHLV